MGYALQFDGVNDYVAMPALWFPSVVTDFAVEYRVRWTTAANHVVFDNGRYDDGIYSNLSSGNITFYINKQDLETSGVSFNDGEWHKVRYVQSGSSGSIYVDDVLRAGPTVLSTPAPTGSFVIGHPTHAPTAAKFDGDFEYLSLEDPNDANNSFFWDARSTSTGSSLPETTGNGSAGTLQLFPTDDSQWINLGGGTTPVSKDASLLWHALNNAQSDSGLMWNALNPVSRDATLLHDVLSGVNSDSTVRWDAVNAVTKDVSLICNVLSSVQIDGVFRWDVLNSVTQDAALLFDVLNSVELDAAVKWDVFNTIASDAFLLWNVESSLASVFSDLSLLWNGSGEVGRDLVLQWDALNTVSRNSAILWDALNSIQIDASIRWDVLNSIAKDIALIWDVEGLAAVTKDLSLKWDVLNETSEELMLRWQVQGDQVTPDLSGKVVIRSLTKKITLTSITTN